MQIPVGAGLSGGSSDAGAVLRMMAALCRIEVGERVLKLALALGADVPFFVDPRPARIGGIGERITPLGPLPRLDLVLAVPPFEVSTAEIFSRPYAGEMERGGERRRVGSHSGRRVIASSATALSSLLVIQCRFLE